MPKKVLEAALFVADRPLRLEELTRITGHNMGNVKKVLGELVNEYDGRALEIAETPEGWHMRVRQDVLPNVAHLTPHSDLTEGCKRTLALILYNEPVKQSDIIKTQGNKAYTYIKKLQKKGLVKSVKKGHTMTLELTQEFETYFGERKDHLKERLREEMKELDSDEFTIVEDSKPVRQEKKEKSVDDIVSEMKKMTSAVYGDDDEEETVPEEEEKIIKAVVSPGKTAKKGKTTEIEEKSGKEKATKNGKSLVWVRGK
ncbi:MAG: SMC-Scp complex subunit ScpB [Candidatus Aenigmatarchaeota archaeon]